MRKQLLNALVALSLVFSGCSLAPAYRTPETDVPLAWSSVAGVGTTEQPDSAPFWQELGSPELDRLVAIALAQNLDLKAALQRIEEARAQAKVAASPLFPAVNASGSGSHTYQASQETNAAHGGGTVSYELDLWGKNRDTAESAVQRTEASRFDREALRLVITSDVTNFYTQVLSLNDRMEIAKLNLNNAEEILRIIEARFAQGTVSGLEVSQQRVAVNNLRAALSALEQSRSTAANALAVLLGMAPQKLPAILPSLASLKMPPVNLTPPASLLTARPDIQSAEANLRAANADIGAARAAFLPSLNLGIDSQIAAGFGGPAVAATTMASSLLVPIFTGGKLTGNLENVTARQRELAAQYQKSVLVAFQEVEDALASLKNNNKQAALSVESVKESKNAYDIAKARLDAGAIDYLTMLDTQRSLYLTEDAQVVIRQAQLQSFVQLRKALGF